MTEDNSDDNIIKVGPLPIEDVYENGQKIRMPVYIKKPGDNKYEEILSIKRTEDTQESFTPLITFVITTTTPEKTTTTTAKEYKIIGTTISQDSDGFYTDENGNKFQIFKKKILSFKNIKDTFAKFVSKKGGKERSKKRRARRGNMTRGRGGVFTSPRLEEERQSVTQRSRKHKKNRTIRRK